MITANQLFITQKNADLYPEFWQKFVEYSEFTGKSFWEECTVMYGALRNYSEVNITITGTDAVFRKVGPGNNLLNKFEITRTFVNEINCSVSEILSGIDFMEPNTEFYIATMGRMEYCVVEWGEEPLVITHRRFFPYHGITLGKHCTPIKRPYETLEFYRQIPVSDTDIAFWIANIMDRLNDEEYKENIRDMLTNTLISRQLFQSESRRT